LYPSGWSVSYAVCKVTFQFDALDKKLAILIKTSRPSGGCPPSAHARATLATVIRDRAPNVLRGPRGQREHTKHPSRLSMHFTQYWGLGFVTGALFLRDSPESYAEFHA
jgi:hypothetical protein